MVKNFEDLFVATESCTNVTDEETDRHRMTA